MMADKAAGRRTQHAVMTGIMSGNAADQRALDAALGVGRHCCRRKSKRQCASKEGGFELGFELGFHVRPPLWRPLRSARDVGGRIRKTRGGGSLRSTASLPLTPRKVAVNFSGSSA